MSMPRRLKVVWSDIILIAIAIARRDEEAMTL